MNFFEQQDRARTRTGLLVLLYALAVLALVAATCLLVGAFFGFTQAVPLQAGGASGLDSQTLVTSLQALSPQTVSSIFALILSVVTLGGLYKFKQLSAGGVAVAEALGGRLLNVNTRDANEKKLLNVVEEMAIASGVPVPPVYLLDEASINAFAAGSTPQNAAIGVTRGAISQLDRDELQGVIAHEFSHIFNGDMRLNMRLMAMLYGILIIGTIGYYIMRASSRGAYVRSRSSNNNSALPFIALGGGLMVIGYAGTFFGNLIKSAVSRQREFLADASAVQFTRNPPGIANALKKIGGFSHGSGIAHPGGAQASHMFFGQAVSFFLNGLFATHPPLAERIARIDKGWQAESAERAASGVASEPGHAAAASIDRELQTSGFAAGSNGSLTLAALSESVANLTGEASPGQYQFAGALIAGLPPEVLEAAHESFGARALVYCMLLDANATIREQQLLILSQHCDALVYTMVQSLQKKLRGQAGHYLDILDLALPALKQLSASQAQSFSRVSSLLIHADNKIELLEWSLYNIVALNIRPARMRASSLRSVGSAGLLGRPLGLVLSVVAHAGVYESLFESTSSKSAIKEQAVQDSFAAAAHTLDLAHLPVTERSAITVDRFSHALALLNRLRPLQKPRVLKALAVAIAHDKVVRPLELQLLRAIALSLDCPMPPLLGAQPVARSPSDSPLPGALPEAPTGAN